MWTTIAHRDAWSFYFRRVPTARLRPRDYLTRWPGGDIRKEFDPVWGQRAKDLAFLVDMIKQRLERTNAQLTATADAADINRITLNRILTGDAWPTFYALSSLSRAMYYPEMWIHFSARIEEL